LTVNITLSNETPKKMSDLLPLVAATLRDKVLQDAQEEIRSLKESAKMAEVVQIVHAVLEDDDDYDREDGVEVEDRPINVYASGSIRDNGRYGQNDRFWQIDLGSEKTCRLVDLWHCRIQVGGGYEVASLSAESSRNLDIEVKFDISDLDTPDSKSILFCIGPNAIWLHVLVKGWPGWQQERENQPFDFDGGEAMPFLCDDVASRYAEATVEFRSIMFQRGTIHPAMQRLIPRKQLQEERSRRDYSGQADTNQEDDDVSIEELPRVVRRFAIDRFKHHLNGRPGRSLAEFLDMLSTNIYVLGIVPLERAPPMLTASDEILIDRIVIMYLDHGRDAAEERLPRMRREG
jgi:hypothetical protein